MSQGVEWAVHVILTLSWLDDDEPVPVAQLAASFDLAPSYLNKQLQALVRAGLLESLPGARGGFRLLRPADRITLLDVVTAVEGSTNAFQCKEIRQHGMGAAEPASHFSEPCAVHSAMRRAELAWRQALAAQTVADVQKDADRHAKDVQRYVRNHFGRD